MLGSSVVIDHICQIWGKSYFQKELKNLYFTSSRIQKQIFQVTKKIPYMIILQCILLEAGEGLDLSKN